MWTRLCSVIRRSLASWLGLDRFSVVVAYDPEGKHPISVVEVYPRDDPHAWNAWRHFREVYGGRNVTCASRKLIDLGPAPASIRDKPMVGPILERVAPGDPRLKVAV
jgi:hypothetical protein